MAGSALPNAAQDSIGLLCYESVFMAGPQILFCKDSFSVVIVQLAVVLWFVLPDFAFHLVELHQVSGHPFS